MTKSYSNELQQPLINTSVIDGKVKAYQATITLAAQAADDTIVIAKARQGEKFIVGFLTASATLGASATIAIGNATTAGKYRAAATFTAVDTPTTFGKNGAMAALEDDEEIIITVGTAALPGSGTLKVTMLFAVNN